MISNRHHDHESTPITRIRAARETARGVTKWLGIFWLLIGFAYLLVGIYFVLLHRDQITPVGGPFAGLSFVIYTSIKSMLYLGPVMLLMSILLYFEQFQWMGFNLGWISTAIWLLLIPVTIVFPCTIPISLGYCVIYTSAIYDNYGEN